MVKGKSKTRGVNPYICVECDLPRTVYSGIFQMCQCGEDGPEEEDRMDSELSGEPTGYRDWDYTEDEIEAGMREERIGRSMTKKNSKLSKVMKFIAGFSIVPTISILAVFNPKALACILAGVIVLGLFVLSILVGTVIMNGDFRK